MIINNKAVSGFKFSFNNKQTSAKSTPKFTSIQFEKNSFTRMHSQLKNSRQYKTDKKKLQSLLLFHEASKPQLKILNSNNSQKSIQAKKEIYDKQKYEEEIKKQSYSNAALSIDNKKLIFINRPKKVELFKKQSIQKLIKKQKKDYESLTLEENEFFQPHLHQKGEGFKSQTKNIISSQKSLNWSFKKNISFLQPIQKRDQSPKSAHSFREPPKALKRFFPPPQPEFIESVTAPQTQKSKKFMQESQNPTFFRRNETKKNIGGSKVLFKTQKANLNLRLNNIGGVSKLNIHID